MCDRCGAGFTFFGLAEPQPALLDAYAAALKQGWRPDIAANDSDLAATIASDANTFLSHLSDTVVRETSETSTGAVRFARLNRWLWDGAFCGEASLIYDVAAPLHDRVRLTASIVPWREGLGYAERVRRHLFLEARDLGVAVADLDRAEEQASSRPKPDTKS